MINTTHMKIDYKGLRKINPQAVRMSVLEYLKASGGNVAEAEKGGFRRSFRWHGTKNES